MEIAKGVGIPLQLDKATIFFKPLSGTKTRAGSSSGNHESNSSIALPSTNLSPLPNIQPALLSNLEQNHLSLYLSAWK